MGRRLFAVLILLGCAAAFAGCTGGGFKAEEKAKPVARAIGEVAVQPDKLAVKRLDPLHQSESKFAKTIDDKKMALAIYDKLEALPPFPEKQLHCPVDNGVQYELEFLRGSVPVSEALVRATGCEIVTVNDRKYWAIGSKGSGFRSLLEKALGLSEA